MRNTWDSLTEELDPLAGETLAECERQAGDVAAGASEARHHALGDRITHAEKDDGNRRRRALRRQRSRRGSYDQDVHLQVNHLSDEIRKALRSASRKSLLDADIATLDVT